MKKKMGVASAAAKRGARYEANETADLYASNQRSEKPLYQDATSSKMAGSMHRTTRHYSSKRDVVVDERDKSALIFILKLSIVALLLLVLLVVIWKGIGLYEKNMLLEAKKVMEGDQRLDLVLGTETFDIEAASKSGLFSERVKNWQEVERMVRSADAFILRNLYDQAIVRCTDALKLDPLHSGALSRLAQLHYDLGNYQDAVNVYVKLLSIEPSKVEVQEKLIRSLEAYGDYDGVRQMAEWYLESNRFDPDVQRMLANARFKEEDYEGAIEAYEKSLQAGEDVEALHKMAAAQMMTLRYSDALASYEKLRRIEYDNPDYHFNVAVCRAQLKLPNETVNALGRAVQVFGTGTVVSWIEDPRLDAVREERAFQIFTDRLAGEEFRIRQEQLARRMSKERQEQVKTPTLRPERQTMIDEKLKIQRTP
jgi:tetratricopeptide (TPR) repeat protein